MADKHDIGGRRLMGRKPLTKVVASEFYGAVCLVSRVNLGVKDMRVGEGRFQVRVDMIGKGAKGLIVPVEAMDVDDKKSTPLVGARYGRTQGLRG